MRTVRAFIYFRQHNKDLVELYKLKPPEFYNYLNQSGCITIDGVSDVHKFDALRLAFNVLRIPLNMVDGIFCVLSAILWLGNTVFRVNIIQMLRRYVGHVKRWRTIKKIKSLIYLFDVYEF